MDFIYRPITVWPQPFTRKRSRSLFHTAYSETLKLLDRELRHLGARDVVLQVALTAEDIRLDGKPRANSKAQHPGLILSFQSKHGPLSYPCDTYLAWEDNLRAIALALQALRTVDRYGVTRRGEQYTGWSQLPPPPNGSMSRAEAQAVLEKASRMKLNGDNFMSVYREAVLSTHPDRGGTPEDFKRVQLARETLENPR